MFYSPPTKTRATRKYWYLLRTPAGDCIVSAACKGSLPAQIQRCKNLLYKSGSSVQIKRIHSRDAYRAIRFGVSVCPWNDKLQYIREILLIRCELDDVISAMEV